MSPEFHAQQKTHFSELRSKAEELFRESLRLNIPRQPEKVPDWQWTYFPRTQEEEAVVNEFKRLYSDIRRLPDLYDPTASYFFDHGFFVFSHNAEKEECEKVLRSVLDLFIPYNLQREENTLNPFSGSKNAIIMENLLRTIQE